MAEENLAIPSSQLSIIVDLTSPFDFKKLCQSLPLTRQPPIEHHYWHFAGLRSYTIPFQSTDDETFISNIILISKSLQTQSSLFPPYWICYKECEEECSVVEVIKKNLKLGRFYCNEMFRIEYTTGALVQLNKYIYEPTSTFNDGCRLVFYHDRFDLDYGGKENKLRKAFKAELMEKCVVIIKEETRLIFFFHMTGNSIDYKPRINDEDTATTTTTTTMSNVSYMRTASPEAQPFYPTVRLIISLNEEKHSSESEQRLSYCYNQFEKFFRRNHFNQCFGLIQSCPSTKDLLLTSNLFMNHPTMSFIKQYCWHMLLSIGYRFQQRLTEGFIQHLNLIEDDDEFYQTSLHIWRRSSEYYFIDLLAELHRYQEKVATAAALSNSHSNQSMFKKDDGEIQRWSIHNPPKHYAYVPSVTLTPTTICVKPLKLVKTNRVLREEKFGGKLMFALVDVKDENGTITLFPHDYRDLRWKIEMLLSSGFDLGKAGRTYRYLHHSQSQLKDKQFWFYHHDGETNFSFDEAYAWMGDFQEERIIAKHAARIAQCFTSAEETIQIPDGEVEYIEDIRTDDQKYNFTDGVGTMSTAIRDKINPRRQFSAIQIRYAGCKGVISVNPDLDHGPTQLRIRESMKKFKCSHDMLELCRISKPRPLYLNRQIIVLLSHRSIADRRFLLLAHDHQKILSESLVYPQQAYELLAEKINRNLFPLRALIHDAQINLIHEPFFRQLLITTGKFELMQMKERTRLKLPRNTARNMIGIVDEYGILEYGQVFIQYTELNGDYINSTESEKTVILKQKVVVTKNPCHHPGDIRVFMAVDVPKLRHLKDVIVFPRRGSRPHPNEISGSDLDGDEYAVIWHPDFVPQTLNDAPYEYDSQTSMLHPIDRPVNRSDIQTTVLNISEQCCVGKLCSLHLANMDLYGVDHPKTLAIAEHISKELDAPKTGHHSITPEQIMKLQEELGDARPDYFDKPYYKPYRSKHILGQLFRSSLRFEPNWTTVQTPPKTITASPIDPLLVHDSYHEHLSSVEELASIYREAIMDIIYVYRFSSDVDLLCRFDSSTPQYKTPLSKQQTDSACLVADSAQIELRQLIQRIRRLFYDQLRSSNPYRGQSSLANINERKMAKASALYIFCYRDTCHARRMLSLPWLFAPLLIETRKANIRKQSKLLSAAHVAQMLEIQPYRLIGQALREAVRYVIDKKMFCFHHSYSLETPNRITITLRPASSKGKRLMKNIEINLIDYLLIEVFHYYLSRYVSPVASSITDSEPNLLESVWQHILTRFVLNECSPLLLLTATNSSSIHPSFLSTIDDPQFWCDEQACLTLHALIDISILCTNHGNEPIEFTVANEYLVSILQKMATTTTNCLFSNE